MRIVSGFLVILAIAVAAVFVRYGSFHPCEWLRYDFRVYAQNRAGPLGAVGAGLAQRLDQFPRESYACAKSWVRFHTSEDDKKLDAVFQRDKRS